MFMCSYYLAQGSRSLGSVKWRWQQPCRCRGNNRVHTSRVLAFGVWLYQTFHLPRASRYGMEGVQQHHTDPPANRKSEAEGDTTTTTSAMWSTKAAFKAAMTDDRREACDLEVLLRLAQQEDTATIIYTSGAQDGKHPDIPKVELRMNNADNAKAVQTLPGDVQVWVVGTNSPVAQALIKKRRAFEVFSSVRTDTGI